jgi:hypothetical protein
MRFFGRLSVALALMLSVALPARADIASLQRLVAIVNANPPLNAGSNDGRWWVSLTTGGDAVGYLDESAVDQGLTREGTEILIVPLPSGGSGGVFTTLIFANPRTRRPNLVGKLDSTGHLGVFLSTGRINAVTPIYGPNDPQCCPSGQKTVRYRLAGAKLVKIDEFSTK